MRSLSTEACQPDTSNKQTVPHPNHHLPPAKSQQLVAISLQLNPSSPPHHSSIHLPQIAPDHSPPSTLPRDAFNPSNPSPPYFPLSITTNLSPKPPKLPPSHPRTRLSPTSSHQGQRSRTTPTPPSPIEKEKKGVFGSHAQASSTHARTHARTQSESNVEKTRTQVPLSQSQKRQRTQDAKTQKMRSRVHPRRQHAFYTLGRKRKEKDREIDS